MSPATPKFADSATASPAGATGGSGDGGRPSRGTSPHPAPPRTVVSNITAHCVATTAALTAALVCVVVVIVTRQTGRLYSGFNLHLKGNPILAVQSHLSAALQDLGDSAAAQATIPPHPSKASFLRIQADPSLVRKEPALLEEFVAAPWLLPSNTTLFDYHGVTDLDQLLALRAMAVAGHKKVVTLMFFNADFADLAENCVYSMVKFGGVRNYLALTWTPKDLAACIQLNMPCADVSKYLPMPLDHAPGAGAFGTHDYLSIVWLKPAVVLHVLQLGYTIFHTDADAVYSHWPVVESFLELLRVSCTDAAFMSEGPVNTGVYAVLPTESALHTWELWVKLTKQGLNESLHDQHGLSMLHGGSYQTCDSVKDCHYKRQGIVAENRNS